jgi:anaerobic magnesium-protoporphyrin IX monomethyl ester cyclase
MGLTRAILVNPPNPPGHVSNKDSMGGFGQLFPAGAPPFPPLDMPYLAAVLGEAGVPVEVIEAGALDLSTNQVSEALRAAGADAQTLLVLRTSVPTVDWDLNVCAALRSGVELGAIAVYGPAVSSLLVRIQQDPSIDYAVLGEPDQTVIQLMRGRPLAEISGLLYRDGAEWRRNPERKFERDLDSIPFPRWELFPTDRYIIPRSANAGRLRFLPMLTSRGCPFGCNYCPYPVGQGLLWRYRSPKNVVDEIEHLIRDFHVEYVLFRDPLFSANKKRVTAICEEIIQRGLTVQWRCETRIDCLDEPTIAIMARAGCTGVNFGVESIDPQIQKNVERKPISESQFVETVALFRKYNIKTFAFFVVGLPGDTLDTILATIRFGLKLKASWIQFTVATPFIGTKLHDWAVDHGLIEAEHYKMISSHEGSMGNENLTPVHVHELHRFAQILQRNFINRRGVLKNENRSDPVYRALRRGLDVACGVMGAAAFALGEAYFRRRITPASQPPAAPTRTRLPAAGAAT